MEPPEKPSDSDCCGSGCAPCIFDIYEKTLIDYETRSSTSDRKVRHDLLSPLKYKPFKLIKLTSLNQDTFLYAFQPFVPDEVSGVDLDGMLPYEPGQHFIMLNLKSPRGEEFASGTFTSNVSRAYTPVSLSTKAKDCLVEFFIKLYEYGHMSAFLKQLHIGDVVYLRGSFGDFKHEPNSKYVMMCAGTGFAPMYPIIKAILEDEHDETLIRLCWACATLDDIVFREEIRGFCKYWNFKATFYLSKESVANIESSVKYGEDIRAQRMSLHVVREQMIGDYKVLICGSDAFNKDIGDYASQCGYKNVFVF